MSLIAKNILPEKFWIIEDDDASKRGTIQVEKDQIVKIILDGNDHLFKTFDDACNQLGIKKSSKPIKQEAKKEFFVNGYPTNTQPYNEMYDAKLKLPMYTKNEKSKSYFAAGYYIIRFDFGWAQAFCPKVITLKRNVFEGPYKTKLEMKEQLRIHNNAST